MSVLIALAALVAGQTENPADGATVVVTARSLDSTERALAACLARHCPAVEDIDASLAHGENLFVAGDYAGARRVLDRSRARNMRHAREFPVEVADLARAYGRIAAFDGYPDAARQSQRASLDALKAGLAPNDARVLAQRMMVGDEAIRQGWLSTGDDIYKSIEKRAIAANLPNVRGAIMLRQAVIYGMLASAEPLYRPEARRRIKRLQDTTDPALAPFRDAVSLLLIKLAALEGDDKTVESTIAALDAAHYQRPLLVYAPPIELDHQRRRASIFNEDRGDGEPQWIDVGFQIGMDGRVGDVAILRKTSTVRGDWPDQVRTSVSGRRYAPIGPAVAPSLLTRTERFSMVHNLKRPTGSRIMMRSPQGTLISLDLTDEPAAAPAVAPPPPPLNSR